MNKLWSLTIEDYLLIAERAKANGKKPGDSMQEELLQLMKERNQQPIGQTELTQEEYAKEIASHSKKVAHIKIDNKGSMQIDCPNDSQT
jgi:hypothetical protein